MHDIINYFRLLWLYMYISVSLIPKRLIIIIIFVYCRLTHATEQKILPQQAEISGIIVA